MTHTIMKLIDDVFERRSEEPRGYVGASMLGHNCSRYIWLKFRWVVTSKHLPRIKRLFRRGHNEELVVIGDLMDAGCEVEHYGSGQHQIDFGGHVKGSTDGELLKIPGMSDKRRLLEIKTHNKKSFDDLEAKGMEESKPIHFIQMQVYMKGIHAEEGIYHATCKDDDRVHIETVPYVAEVADQAILRGQKIALLERPPERLRNDPTWYQCKMCEFHNFCHGDRFTRNVNCRTCAHSTATKDGTFRCELFNNEITPDEQLLGCPSHAIHPDLVPWPVVTEGSDGIDAQYLIEGDVVKNGANMPESVRSQDLIDYLEDLPR